MWLNSKNSSDIDNLQITEHEITILEDYFVRYREGNELIFKNSVEYFETELKKYTKDQAMNMVYRAMIIMKRNGAKSVVEFDKLKNNPLNNEIQEFYLFLNDDELEIAKDFISLNRNQFPSAFDTPIEEYKELILALNTRWLTKENGFIYGYFLALKAIVSMMKNWAKSLDELDKIKIIFEEQNISDSAENKNTKIEELKSQEEIQKSKEQIQAEIMSYFIQNPENNVTLWMNISKDPKDACEIIDFWDAQYEDQNLNNIFNLAMWIRVWWVKIKADETWEQGESFSKELVIDRKTDKRWMLFVWKKWFKIEQVDFDDITKYDVPYEAYFVYKDNWQTYIRSIRNERIKARFKSADWNITGEAEFWTEWLQGWTPEEIKKAREEIVYILTEAKKHWTLDSTIEALVSQSSVSDEMKDIIRKEFYKMAKDL